MRQSDIRQYDDMSKSDRRKSNQRHYDDIHQSDI